jgi:hypothetical protein
MSADARPFRRWTTGWEWERNSKHQRESSSGRVSTYYIQILYKYTIEDMRTRFGRERLQSSYSLARVRPTKRSNRHNKSRAAVGTAGNRDWFFLVHTLCRIDCCPDRSSYNIIPDRHCMFFFSANGRVCVCVQQRKLNISNSFFFFWGGGGGGGGGV